MGYTHYWRRKKEIEPEIYTHIQNDFQKLLPALETAGVRLAGGMGDGHPVFLKDELLFNGYGSESYESFDFPRMLIPHSWEEPDQKDLYFQFCKTDERPYDLAVTACLLVAMHHLGPDIALSSDGGEIEWKAAHDLCEQVLGYSQPIQI